MVAEEKLLEIEIEPGMRDRQEYDFIAEGSYNATTRCIALWVQRQVTYSKRSSMILFQMSNLLYYFIQNNIFHSNGWLICA